MELEGEEYLPVCQYNEIVKRNKTVIIKCSKVQNIHDTLKSNGKQI